MNKINIRITKHKQRDFNRWVKSDSELLNGPLERTRQAVDGQPQTVKWSCKENGLVPASDDWKRLTKGKNPGMTDHDLAVFMDKWTPGEGAKWLEGEEKVPTDIGFASNPVNVLELIPNPGGLTGIPFGALVYVLDMLDYATLGMYATAAEVAKGSTKKEVPERYWMHFTISKNGSNVVNPLDRFSPPVMFLMTAKSTMYIREELLDVIGDRTNRYTPPWSLGAF